MTVFTNYKHFHLLISTIEEKITIEHGTTKLTLTIPVVFTIADVLNFPET